LSITYIIPKPSISRPNTIYDDDYDKKKHCAACLQWCNALPAPLVLKNVKSIPGRVKPNLIKLYFASSPLHKQH